MDIRKFSILDCTLRDGGYYTNWDYSEELLLKYFDAINQLPIDYVEIGYLNAFAQDGYRGAFYYLPVSTLEFCKKHCEKKLVAMLDEKLLKDENLSKTLRKVTGFIHMIRIAVKPENLDKAQKFSKEIKEQGFEVAINIMYATNWDDQINHKLSEIDKEHCDFLYIVDSYGGMLPGSLHDQLSVLDQSVKVSLGFHGHNNLELALANSLVAIENDISIIDSTIMGMGRGAGNLRTELLLSVLSKTYSLEVDFDILHSLCNDFEELKKYYKWGSNLPFMVSAIRSEKQDAVNSQVKKRFFSLNRNQPVTESFKSLNPEILKHKKVLLVGGGESVSFHSKAILIWLKQNPDAVIVFSSSKNVPFLIEAENLQLHFLAGNEGKRLEQLLNVKNRSNHKGLLAPDFFDTNNYITKNIEVFSMSFDFSEVCGRSITSLILQINRNLEFQKLLICGYDGYDQSATKEQIELFQENQGIFNEYKSETIFSVTPTKYDLNQTSVYSII